MFFLVTDLDKPITAQEALNLSNKNKDDSIPRVQFREAMKAIRESSSWGNKIAHIFYGSLKWEDSVLNSLFKLGYEVKVNAHPNYLDPTKMEYDYVISFAECTCGKEKANQPAHSNWCDKVT